MQPDDLARNAAAEIARCYAEPPTPTDPMPGEPLTELGYAHRFIHVYGDRLHYVPAWRRWLVWDGTRWAHDNTGQAARWMKVDRPPAHHRRASHRRRPTSVGPRCNAARRGGVLRRVAGALTLASTEAEHRGHTRPSWTPTRSCSTAERHPRPAHRRAARATTRRDLLTKIAGADYRPDATGAQLVGRFLDRVQPDETMRGFLARLLGHALEGRVSRARPADPPRRRRQREGHAHQRAARRRSATTPRRRPRAADRPHVRRPPHRRRRPVRPAASPCCTRATRVAGSPRAR